MSPLQYDHTKNIVHGLIGLTLSLILFSIQLTYNLNLLVTPLVNFKFAIQNVLTDSYDTIINSVSSLKNAAKLKEENLDLKTRLLRQEAMLHNCNVTDAFQKQAYLQLVARNYPMPGHILLYSSKTPILEDSNPFSSIIVASPNIYVGKVKKIYNSWITVETIFSPNHTALVLLPKQKEIGRLLTTNNGILIEEIPTSAPVQQNDPVYLYDPNLPPNSIIVGKVSKVHAPASSPTLTILITPMWDPHGRYELFLVPINKIPRIPYGN